MIRKPMLASKITDIDLLVYPTFASPKFDGIRALTLGQLVSRTLKPIPNHYIRERAKGLPNNLDGELILTNGSVAGAEFTKTTSAVMRRDGEPDVKYYIFDYVRDSLNKPAIDRQKDLLKVYLDFHQITDFIVLVIQKIIHNKIELLEYEQECIDNGYEGIIIRSLGGIYKEGRSTELEGYLLKRKPFEDGEAIILGFEELMHNDNEAEKDLLGYTKRSSSKENLTPANTLGKLVVKSLNEFIIDGQVISDVEFEIGTGFDDALRYDIWHHQSKYRGKVVKYKYQLFGMKDKPRLPVFLGFRDRRDM